ncbi:hypothetical protein [Streptomyces sp. UNOC14_S4]|uniref:hypothetical protein n=1 Tax=Streptomyces sp. UNOC14_S4 TaxID=2872340 RepID=UPI001E37136B|nr:hypothetical protein [Streptomyces sp. UNOC14_S4]MCC3768528.1 hypothetical protein [Streptomyces sp. UNOC14_S4]
MALAVTSLVGAPAAQAGGPVVTGGPVVCAGQENTTYSPGLSLVPQPTRLSARTAYLCSVRPGETVEAKGTTEGASPEASCLALNSPRAHERVEFPGGRHLEIAYEGSAVRVLGVNIVHLTGHVLEGFGEIPGGTPVTRDVGLLPGQPPTECATGGVTAATGQGQLRIGI